MEITTEEAQMRVELLGAHTKLLVDFFEEFTSLDIVTKEEERSKPWGDKKYKNQLQDIKNCTQKVLKVYLDDIREYFLGDADKRKLYEGLMLNTHRYLELLYSAADDCLGRLEKSKTEDDDYSSPQLGNCNETVVIDAVDELRERRMKQNKLPVYLSANFEIWIVPGDDDMIVQMKSVNADSIGSLSFIEADVTRVGLLKPKVQVATYECDVCHNHTYKAVDGPSFMPLTDCASCVASKNARGTLKFHPRLSKFEKYQDVKVQEPLKNLSDGELPRTLRCEVSGELTQKLKPGDEVFFCGVLLPVVQTGHNPSRFTLLAEKVFRILYLRHKKSVDKQTKLDSDLRKQIEELRSDPDIYERLAYSIAPEIYGHDDIKKALLLQLIGGCPKEKSDGGQIRGNIHILLLGDPGIAKSQLLKKVSSISPRGVYTTGKGSSTTGMTAAIVKDPTTGETALEGGALVLADTGLCCIDEFDKMDDHDRSAIYEVMEQQTVSIAKAGHCSYMPARSAVLAAANPVGGMYDVRKSVFVNMNLPAALLTRFDLQFLLLDRADRVKDAMLAEHVIDIVKGAHKEKGSQKYKVVDKDLMRSYIALAKDYNPVMPSDIIEKAADWYVQARQSEKQQELFNDDRFSYTTPRSMLAILRICQALARLRFSDVVESEDFDEAIRLTDQIRVKLTDALNERKGRKKATPAAQVMLIIRKMRDDKKQQEKWDGWLSVCQVEQQVLAAGLRRRDLDDAIGKYSKLAVLVVDKNNSDIAFPEDVMSDS